ncbi:MAG: hypothetical protein QOI49_2287 [Verrucomicrobiota bacterium]
MLVASLSGLNAAATVALLDGRLTLDTTDAFVPDQKPRKEKQSIAYFTAPESDAWGIIMRGTHGLRPEGLPVYLKNKVAEYTKGMSWLPKLNWLKKEIVTIDGRKWADMRYIAPRDNPKNPRDGLLYTRILGTSYEGQLLEIMFTSNTDENPVLKDRIDQVLDSMRLEKSK